MFTDRLLIRPTIPADAAEVEASLDDSVLEWQGWLPEHRDAFVQDVHLERSRSARALFLQPFGVIGVIDPTPIDELKAITDTYPNAELVWVQEEPENQGAWPFLALEFAKVRDRGFRVVSRPASASPATGSSKVHAAEQAQLLKTAIG